MNSIYVDELTKCELEQLKKYNIVGVDPGKRNIIQMVDKYKNKLRYTCMQRRFECGFKHAKQEMKKIKTKRIIKTESVLSYYNSKSCTVKNFVKYIRLKNIINNVLTNFYQKEIFRKLKWRSYIKTQKSIANLINNIKIKFKKDDKKICLAYGNWSLSKQMRHYLSTPGIGLKNKLSKYFKIITVDEYKTSKICSRCDKELEKFLIRKNPRPYKEEYKTVHSLLRCKNVDCNKLWDRDINASINMIRIIKSHIKNNNRLEILKRTKKKN